MRFQTLFTPIAWRLVSASYDESTFVYPQTRKETSWKNTTRGLGQQRRAPAAAPNQEFRLPDRYAEKGHGGGRDGRRRVNERHTRSKTEPCPRKANANQCYGSCVALRRHDRVRSARHTPDEAHPLRGGAHFI